MSARWLLTIIAFAASALCATAAMPIVGGWFNLFDDASVPRHGPVQLAGFSCGRASDKPDDVACAVYVGVGSFEKYDRKAIIDLADQVFDEMIGFDCARRAFKSDKDALSRPIPRCTLYVGDILVSVRNEQEFRQSLLHGAREADETRVDYVIKQMPAGAPKGSAFYATEYVRVSQLDIAVGPSHREPNRNAVSKQIEPGVTIGLENAIDITYFEEDRPTHVVFFQTTVSINDEPAITALCEKVVRAFGGERAARHELNGVRVSAYNEPKRSRFHFRPLFTYDTDRNGKKL